MLAIYKPQRGERPLWDFPRGTLCHREVAALRGVGGAGLGDRPRHRAARRAGRHRHDAAVRRPRSRGALLHAARGARRRVPAHGRVRHRDQQHRPQGRALPARRRRRHASSASTTASRSTRSGSCAPSSGTSRGEPIPPDVCADLHRLADELARRRRARSSTAARPLRARRGAGPPSHRLLRTGVLPDADDDYHSYPWPMV